MSRNIPFGLLAALPTGNPQAALAEDDRAIHGLHTDGFTVICEYNGVFLGDASVDPTWEDFHRRHDVVFVPDAYAPAPISRPDPLVKLPFENVRTVLASCTFGDLAGITCTLAHSGGALPMLFSRLKLLGTQPWVPNVNNIHSRGLEEAHVQLAKYCLDTAASAPTGIAPALLMMAPDRPVYGMGCGVQCSAESILEANKEAVLEYESLLRSQRDAIGQSVLSLLPVVVATLGKCCLAEGSCFVTDA